MNSTRLHKGRGLVWLILVGVVSIGLGCAQTVSSHSAANSGSLAESLAARYHEGSIQSVELADQALEEVSAARKKLAPRFTEEEQACYDRFFTNRCLDDVEERQRLALQQLRRVEVEANAFKRRNKVERRDDRLKEKDGASLRAPGDTGGPSIPVVPGSQQ